MFLATVIQAKRYISPRIVLAAAPLKMRVQFWALVVSGVWIASVTVSARGEIVQQTNVMAYWPMLLAAGTWIFSAGAVWAQFSALKSQIESLEGATVKKDVLAETLTALRMEIRGLRDLLERDRDWRNHEGKE